MNLPQTITKRINELGALTQLYLSGKVPQPGQNPYATGRLQRSLKISYFVNSDSIGYKFSYLDYGVYTNLGTKQYNEIKYGSIKSSPFNLPPFRGYVKGSGGIRPQYWTSMTEAGLLKKFKDDIKNDLKSYIKKQLKK